MDRAWKDRMTKDPSYQAKVSYAKDAFNAGCWIYSSKTGNIYTPREFIDSAESVDIHRGKEEKGVFRIVNPYLWAQRLIDDLNKRTEEIQLLYKKMTDYYDAVPKPKTKK